MATYMSFIKFIAIFLSIKLKLVASSECQGAQAKGRNCLIIIDVQNCFLPGGTLPVQNGDEVIPVINDIRKKHNFDEVFLSQDWHCVDHVSFASQHPGYNPYDSIELEYDVYGNLCTPILSSSPQPCVKKQATLHGGKISQNNNLVIIGHRLNQTLWPDHCVMNSDDAKLSNQLNITKTDVVIQKGNKCQIDSYSAFYDNGRFSATELNQKLRERNVTQLFIVGLALDYCVYYTAVDSILNGYETFVVKDATRGISEETTQSAIEEMNLLGVHIINSDEIDLKTEC